MGTGKGLFLFVTMFVLAQGPNQHPIHWVTDHSCMHAWSYTWTPSYVFMAQCFIMHRNNITFYLHK